MKANKTINWPTTTYFTMSDLVTLNPHMLTSAEKNNDITLRVRLINAIQEDGKVAEIGYMTGGKGRPRKVYAMTPVTEIMLNKAEADGIGLIDNAKTVFHVMSVSNPTPTTAFTPIGQSVPVAN